MDASHYVPLAGHRNHGSWQESASHTTIDLRQYSHIYEQNPTFQLHMVQKKEYKSDRPKIRSTKCQRLSFFRAYTASANKTEILCRHTLQFNRFLWLYTLNLIFKSIPHTFVQLFFAAYTPEQHIFLSKMVPICIGFNFLVVATSLFEVLTCIDSLLLMFHYFINGLFYKNPWNRCKNTTYFDEGLNETIRCYALEEFTKHFVNITYYFSGHTYKTLNNESFQVAQVEYYRLNIGNQFQTRDFFYFLFLFSIVIWLTFYVANSNFWKALHYCHWTIMTMDALTFLYLVATVTTDVTKKENYIDFDQEIISRKLWLADVDMLAESTTAPPVTHILTARSTQPINPSRDSTAIVLSNAIIYMLRGLLTAKMTSYCEGLVRAPIYYSRANAHNFFFLWPMFYASFYLGDIYNLLFLGFNFFTEILIVTVAYRCLLETVIHEWTKLKPLRVIIISFICAVFINSLTTIDTRLIFYIYGKSFATLCETIFLYLMYPLGRLVDDYTFHYGTPPTWMRKLSLQLVPFYYLFKFTIMMKTLFDVSNNSYYGINVAKYSWSWSLIVLPLILGAVYQICKNIYFDKNKWNSLFIPIPNWGQKDFAVRQLRKQYDSRVYITSDVPRQLSRYIIAITEYNVYEIDVRYDFRKPRDDRRTTNDVQKKDS